MEDQNLSNEFSDESDIEQTPNENTKENSNIEATTIKKRNKPKRGQWIVKLEKLIKCQNCNIFLLNSEQTAKHSQKHL